MIKRIFRPMLVAVVACALLLSGCSDFDEMKSKRLLGQAETHLQQGNEEEAEQALTNLIAKYPGTQSGDMAKKYLAQLLKQRELRERAEFAKVLDSYQQVLNGYRALYAEYPRSLAVLDGGEYFFDSAYLEEITPDGYQVYLWLKSDGSGYRAWCVTQEKERGYAVEALSQKLVPFDRDEIVQKLESRFRTIAWNGKLVALQSQN